MRHQYQTVKNATYLEVNYRHRTSPRDGIFLGMKLIILEESFSKAQCSKFCRRLFNFNQQLHLHQNHHFYLITSYAFLYSVQLNYNNFIDPKKKSRSKFKELIEMQARNGVCKLLSLYRLDQIRYISCPNAMHGKFEPLFPGKTSIHSMGLPSSFFWVLFPVCSVFEF